MAELHELFKEAWAQALVGLNAAEQEAERVLTRLADVAGFSPDDVRRHAREFGERLGNQRREAERAIEDAVKRATGRFKLPNRDEIEGIQKRLENLADRIDAIERKRGA
jgi:hypothetical protein